MGELKKIVEFVEKNVLLKKIALRRMSLIVGEDVTKLNDEAAVEPRRIVRFREAAETITNKRMNDHGPRRAAAFSLPVVQDARTGESLLFGQAMVYHGHHYNIALQRTIEDPATIDGKGLLINAAEEVVFSQLQECFDHGPRIMDVPERFDVAVRLFRECGFGLIAFDRVDREGGVVIAPVSHYAVGWKSRFGKRISPGCFFVSGFIAGAMEAIYECPMGSYTVLETRCVAAGDDDDRFQVSQAKQSG